MSEEYLKQWERHLESVNLAVLQRKENIDNIEKNIEFYQKCILIEQQRLIIEKTDYDYLLNQSLEATEKIQQLKSEPSK